MKLTNYLTVDSPHWNDVEKHKDHKIAIDYFNCYKLPDNAVICWQASMYSLGIVYLGRIPEKEEEVEIPELEFNPSMLTMPWKKFKNLEQEGLE